MRFLFSKPKETRAVNAYSEMSENSVPMHCVVHSISETGPTRDHNEDSILTYFSNDKRDDLICVLADGMGGHNAGEVASRMACDSIKEYIYQNKISESILADALQHAHKKIVTAGNSNPDQKGMETTATTVTVKNNQLHFAHIGDSRLYQLRDGKLVQLTKDHTLVNEMYEKGEITKAERDVHSMKNVLMQALGTTAIIDPQTSNTPIEIQLNDKYLLCSDGIYDVFSDGQLNDLLNMQDTSLTMECIKCLATDRRASDNFSAIIISFSDDFLPTTPITKEQNIMS